MEDFFMIIRTRPFPFALYLLAGILSSYCHAETSADSVVLYTPYTMVTVSPGESVNYSIEVMNSGSEIATVPLSLAGLPKGWNYTIKSGNYYVEQLSVLPHDKKTVSFNLEVPLKVNKGTYRFKISAGNSAVLPLLVHVSEQGTFKTEFTSKQANMEGHAKSTFTFNAELRNRTGEKQLYSLRADVPRGWNVIFKPNYKQATSVEIEANGVASFNIDVDPPDNLKAGTYKVPVMAVTSSTSANLELEVVITGSYEMELTTPTGLLSTRVTAGDERNITLLIRNTGSAELQNIDLSSSTPINWKVTFDPRKIDKLEAGKDATVQATIKVDKKAIAGDYATNMTAKTPEVSSTANFRIAVKTPMLWGWVGILIILASLGSIFYLFRKYGRR